MERVLLDWQHMGRRMSKADQAELERLICEVRNRRSAIDGSPDADLERVMMLAALIHLSGERHESAKNNAPNADAKRQSVLDGSDS